MNPVDGTLPFIFLNPGEMYLSDKPSIVATILGSCIGVTMFHPRLRIAAICHNLLPSRGNSSGNNHHHKYVDSSLKIMISKLERYAIKRREIVVKLFGGSDMFEISNNQERINTVGAQNVEMALKILKEEGLRVLTSDVGGKCGRKLFFHTHTGEVFLKRLKGKKCQEQSYASVISKKF